MLYAYVRTTRLLRYALLLGLVCGLLPDLSAQERDSLERELRLASVKDSRAKTEALIEFSEQYLTINPSMSEEYANRAVEAAGPDYAEGRGKAYLLLGQLAKNKFQYDQTMAYYSQALNIFRQNNESDLAARAAFLFGRAHFDLGEYVKSLEYGQLAKELLSQEANAGQRAAILTLLCDTHYNLGGNDKAIPECLEALRTYDDQGDQRGQSAVLNTLGTIYLDLNQYNKSRRYFFEALEMAREIQNWPAIANSLSTIGDMYLQQGEHDDALVYFDDALNIQLQIGNLRKLSDLYLKKGQALVGLQDISTAQGELAQGLRYAQDAQDLSLQAKALLELGKVQGAQGQQEQGIETIQEALNLAQRANARPILLDCYRNLAKFYDELGNIEEAFIYFNLYMRQNEAIYTRETARRIAEAEALYELEQKEKQIGLLEKENEIQLLQANQRRLLNYSLMAGILLLLVLAIVAYSGYRLKLRSNKALHEQKEAINRQKEEIEAQRDDIQAKNQQITEFNLQLTDSIRYARQIQSSLLPEEKLLKGAFPESFVFYKPKDIVSGDFYWYVDLADRKMIAAVDCTGHGVPGAFMTVLANTLLNQIVLEAGILEPNMIITLLDQKVQSNLHQHNMMDNLAFDGMDISLCAISKVKREVSYCGAKLPLYHAHAGGMVEIKGDRYPVGSGQYEEKYFTAQTINYEYGDCLYLSSDGFQDQFGGPRGKKFMKSRFREMLGQISSKPVAEQLNLLSDTFHRWKSGEELTDDVMVLGIKL